MARDATAKETSEFATWIATSWGNRDLTNYAESLATARDRVAAPLTQHRWDAGEYEGTITLFFNLGKLRKALDRAAAKECKRRGFSTGGLATSKRGGPKGSPVLRALVEAVKEKIKKAGKIEKVRDDPILRTGEWDEGRIVVLRVTPKDQPPFEIHTVARWSAQPPESSGTIQIGDAGVAPVRRYHGNPERWAREAVGEVDGTLLRFAGVESRMDRLQREIRDRYPWINVRRFTSGNLVGLTYDSHENEPDTIGRKVTGAIGGDDYEIIEVKRNPTYRKPRKP